MSPELTFQCDYCEAKKSSSAGNGHFPEGWTTFALRETNGSIRESLYFCEACTQLLEAFIKATPEERKGFVDFNALRKQIDLLIEEKKDIVEGFDLERKENKKYRSTIETQDDLIDRLKQENEDMKARLDAVSRAAASVRRAALPAPVRKKGRGIIKAE